MTKNKPYNYKSLYLIMLHIDYTKNNYNLDVIEDIFKEKIAPVYLAPRSNSIYLTPKIKGTGKPDGRVRYSDHWNCLGRRGDGRFARTDIEVKENTWYKGIYSNEHNHYVIVKEYDSNFNNPTREQVIDRLTPYNDEYQKLVTTTMTRHDIEGTKELNKRCKQNEIFYKGESVRKITPIPLYNGYYISIGKRRKKICNTTWDNNHIVDSSGNLIDISPLMPSN